MTSVAGNHILNMPYFMLHATRDLQGDFWYLNTHVMSSEINLCDKWQKKKLCYLQSNHKVITETVSIMYTLGSHMAGNCVYQCECAREKALRGEGHVKTGKALVHKKQTNKAQAAVIKSSLVLVMHRNAAKQQTELSFLTNSGQNLELV